LQQGQENGGSAAATGLDPSALLRQISYLERQLKHYQEDRKKSETLVNAQKVEISYLLGVMGGGALNLTGKKNVVVLEQRVKDL